MNQDDIKIDEEKMARLRCFSNQRLIESGEKERLNELLQTRLLECGWRDELVSVCREHVKRKGIDGCNVDDMINEVTPKARQLVPDAIKRELLQRIKQFIVNEIHNNRAKFEEK